MDDKFKNTHTHTDLNNRKSKIQNVEYSILKNWNFVLTQNPRYKFLGDRWVM